jgi:predicted Zn-dependent peptidase
VAQEVFQHTFPNGLTLLGEQMGHVRSAAMNFLVPAGCAFDPRRHPGLASVLSDLITRGAGERDSRELTLALDNLGLDRDESVGVMHMRFWGSTLATNLPAALEIYADILRRPHLPEEELDAVKALALQELQGLEDEPRQKMFIELRKRHYPPPLSNDRRGTEEGVSSITLEDVRAFHRQHFRPHGSILSVAGNIEWEALRDQVGRLFGDWDGGAEPVLKLGRAGRKQGHLTKETTQTQIGIAYASVPIGHREYYAALGAVNVLSGGMSARLFTEVREKRGLCYSVWATYQTFKDRAAILCYAGTTNERAQETLDVTLQELIRLGKGITKDELDRCKARAKSSLIMQQESSSSRASSIARDWYHLGRVTTLDEVSDKIDELTVEVLLEHIAEHPAENFTILTLGPEPLEVHLGVS